ncbi:MAG: TIM barrel protein [Chryseolinea sp.]
MILGISSFTYGWAVGVPGNAPSIRLTAMDLVNKAIALNITCLQIGDNLPLHALDEYQREALRSLVVENNIRLEIGARTLTEGNLFSYISVARFFGSSFLRFVVDGDDYEPTIDTIIHVIREATPELTNAGITLGIENHDRFKAKELAEIMEKISDPHVGICLDCVNSLGAGEGLDYVTSILSPYTVNLHIKDFVISRLSHNMGFTVNGTPTGRGMIDVPGLLQALKPFDRCQSAVLEQWVPPEKTIEETIGKEEKWAFESLKYLQQLPYFHHTDLRI